jgi:GST-like protein
VFFVVSVVPALGFGMSEYVVYGAQGSGSVMVEAALTLLGLPYRLVEAYGDDPTLFAANPMRQVPALVLPSGELMTESAAILIWLADDHPEARLAPTMASAQRPAFLRWMAFLSAAIYALYWIRDDPGRIIDDPAIGAVAKARIGDRFIDCWRIMEAQTSPGRYILGDDLTVLDLYVTVISRWAGGRARFEAAAPRLAEVARRVDADPRLTTFWAQRFPFS